MPRSSLFQSIATLRSFGDISFNSERRLVVSAVYATPNLATSTCTRTLANRVLTEAVHLDGAREDLSDEQLENFIESFPIQEAAACWRA